MNERNATGIVNRANLARDGLSSLVVFLVALPLCMGIAIASGAPVAAGLVTGIVGGLIVGLFSGAPMQVSGPAAGLTVVCAEVISEHGLPALGIVVMFAGLLQFVAGVFKLGQWFRAVSPAVVHGMLAGIGVLILSSQLHVMVDDRPRQGGLANLLSIPEAIRKGLPLPPQEGTRERQKRLELLQTFGALHERQAEITAHVNRLVLRHGDGGDEAYQAEQLKPYVPLQQAIIKDLRSAREKIEEALLPRFGEDEGPTPPDAVQQARWRLGGALVDLEGSSIAQAAESQKYATEALADVLAGLKSHDWAAKVGICSILIIMIWQWLAPRRLRFIPAPLLAVVIVTVSAWAGSLPVLYVEVPDRLVDGLTLPTLNTFADVPISELLTAGLFMAVIASAETLLCATAVDRMHHGPRTQYDRELAAQGVGNLICGAVGALPMTGVIVRSAANVQAGAKSRLSAILHGVWLLIFVVALGFLLRMIPTAALAGILVYTGFRLIDYKGFLHLWKTSRTEAVIFLITVAVIVVQDLLTGVIPGIVLSAMKLLFNFSRLDVQITDAASNGSSSEVTVRLTGAATFLRLPQLAGRLEEVPLDGDVRLDMRRLFYLDDACLELLKSWIEQRRSEGQKVTADPGRLHVSRRVQMDDQSKTEDSVRLPPTKSENAERPAKTVPQRPRR